MVAAFSASARQQSDRPEGMPWIHSSLDDAALTPEAFRVFCHLARKARCDRHGRWYAWPSLDDIAAVCFRPSYPNSPASVLRRKAYDAINELEQRQLLEVQRFKGKGNYYYLLPLDHWQPATAMSENRNIRKGRCKKDVAPDPGRIRLGTVVPDPPRIRLVSVQKALETPQEGHFEEISIEAPDPPRITKYIYPEYLEKERNANADRFAIPESAENLTREISLNAPAALENQPQDPPQKANTSKEDTFAAATATPQKKAFESDRYHWRCYTEAGSGGSQPEFYPYMLRRMQAYSDRRVRNGNKKIDNLEEYTLGVIQRDGARFYEEFEIDAGLRSPPVVSALALPSDAPTTAPIRALADSQAGGSNGSLQVFQASEAERLAVEASIAVAELEPEEILQNRQTWFQTLLARQHFGDLKFFLDGLIARGERSQVEQLLQQFPEADFYIAGRKVWRNAHDSST